MFHTGATTRTGHSNKCKACTRAYCRSDHGSQLRRSNALRRNYGLTLADYDEMVERQGGMCACCKRGLGVKPVVDHCHESGKVRGIVCYGCNTGLGKIGDNAEGAYRAEMYLWQTRDVLGELTSGRHTVAELIGVAA